MNRISGILSMISTLACAISQVNGQNLKLELNRRAEDAHYQKLILVCPVFAVRNDSVSNVFDVSSAKMNDPVFWRAVKLPEMNPKYRKGFTWIYNGASELEFAKAYTLAVIENPGWTFYPSRIWIDHNQNFDLTDDGPGDTFTLEQPFVANLGDPNSGYKVSLEHFPAEKFKNFVIMNDQAVRKLQGNREFMGTAASLREKRLNVVCADWNNGRDSFSIGIKDVNCNGIYNEDIDVLMITSYQGTFDALNGVNLKNGKGYLEWNNASYSVTKISLNGAKMELFRDTAARLRYSLNKGQKLPRFKYCTATKPSKHRSIRNLKGKYVYIYIWRDGAEEFLRDSGEWHALGRDKKSDFVTLGLNYGASARYVFQYNNYFGTSIKQGFSSNDVNNRLLVKQVPMGILIDRKQRIIAVGLRPGEVQRTLSDHLSRQPD